MVTTRAAAQHTASSGSQVGLPSTGFCSRVTNATTTIEVKITSTCSSSSRWQQTAADSTSGGEMLSKVQGSC